MAVGDLVVPYGYEFRGLSFGTGTDFVTEEVTGLLSSATARDSDVDKAHDHGSNPGTLLYGKRIISFNMKIKGTSADIEGKIATAQRIFQAPRIRYTNVPEPFVFQRPGGVKKVCYVRCTKRDFPSNFKTARGFAVGSVELVAPDPLIYSLTPSQAILTLDAGVVAGTNNATMNGDHADGASPVLTITGPATNPIIQNATDDGRAMRFDVVLAANDALRITVKTRRVERRVGLAGDWNKEFGLTRTDNQWWKLLPGVNVINYNRTGSATASTLTIDWSDTWS